MNLLKDRLAIFSLIVLSVFILMSVILVKNSWSQELNLREGVVSEEKKEALEKGEKGKSPELEREEKVAPVWTPAGPLTPEMKEWHKSRLPHSVEHIKNNMDKNDLSIEPTLVGLFYMIKPEEAVLITPHIVEVLVEVARKHKLPSIRCQALSNLKYLGDNSAVPGLVNALNTERDMRVRLNIAVTLVACEEKKVPLPILVDIVRKKDIDKWKIDTEGWFYEKIISEKERKKSVEGWKENSIPSIALNGLAKIGTEEAKSVIRKALEDGEPSVRLTAARIMSGFGEESLAFPVIADIAQDPNVNNLTRKSAIGFLGYIGDERAKSVIKELLNDEDKSIQEKAIETLQKIGK